MDDVTSLTEFSSVIVPLSVVLALALGVERFLEILKHIVDLFIGMSGTRKIPEPDAVKHTIDDIEKKINKDKERTNAEEFAEQNTTKHQELLTELRSEEPTPDEVTKQLKEAESKTEWSEEFANTTVLAVAATDPDHNLTMKAFILQLLAFAIGIILARVFEVHFFSALLAGHEYFLEKLGDQAITENAALVPLSIDYLLTGLLIGGGSKPIHILIRFITQRKVVAPKVYTVAKEENTEQAKPEKAPVVEPSVASSNANHDWVDIEYHGGVDRQILETVHKRLADPTMIVYHHTAMHSNSTFEDVVRVIKARDWVTGYNCVIMADGSIKPFCRWDRFGNHAVGYNRKSLGLSFNGNFESNPDTPFSNPDGRAGIQRPTEAQLKSGARVIALWTFLYNIAEDFENTIIPHKNISSKACPGNNFPYEEFKRLISYYRQTWEKSEFAKSRIAAFKLKPYVYV